MSFPPEKFIEKEQRQIFFRRIFRRVFLEDWGTKLIALGIALALWVGVTGLRTTTTFRFKNVALNLRNSNDMEITNTPVQEVDIVVTGDKQKIDRLNARDLIMSVDLTDIKSGDRIVQLTPETIGLDLPSGLKLEEIQPNKIAVRLEKVEEREIDVKPDLDGNLAEGFEIYSTNITPTKVRVRGAESFVKSLDSVSTEKINIENLKESFVARQTGLNIVNPKVTLLDTIVDVSFVIGEKRTERMFLVPVKMENEMKNATIVLYGGRSLMEKLRTEDLHIEITKAENGANTPQLILPTELQNNVEIRKIKLPS
jgi:YbbR-like protein